MFLMGAALLLGPEVAVARAASWVLKTFGGGQKVYRVFGDEAKKDGQSWTTVDPRKLNNPRDTLGLPNANSGRFVAEGKLTNTEGVHYREGGALAADGNKGGAKELIIPNSKKQVTLDKVSGVNPEY